MADACCRCFVNAEHLFCVARAKPAGSPTLPNIAGIYSDVHALSLMYAGEMCYWLVTYSKRWDRPLHMAHALPLGKRLLQDYISAVEGPLQGAGWNCTRARQLLAQLGEEEQC
ncbi:hypothetical protein HPB49_022274 [Dermacentor silvarum]|uniref:Uncharacterized protein n=1 Tax=Dermacentor silvarum TaxID=543639 RepID=A0ACB8DL89_DERSI|nr:hypothetical protein HPB49_022274 [Dermacentor silvarum]